VKLGRCETVVHYILAASSNFDSETMTEALYHCYYILQPSNNGPMLMRHLAGEKEVKQALDN
jgi:hypothetical protein